MSNWFSWLRSADSYVIPQGYSRISKLKCSDPASDASYRILDWRPAPYPPHEPGSHFIWLEIEGEREPFYLSRAESLHLEAGLVSTATNVRVVKNRGSWYVLPINLKKESSPRVLPSPPKAFPPPPTS
jgi:hypothetical protein